MPIANVAEMIRKHAKQSADADSEINQPVEMLFLIPHECERLKKIRLWALIISGVLILTIWSNMELVATSLLRGVVMTALFCGIGFSFFTWTSAKLDRLRAIAVDLKAQAKSDGGMREDIQKLHLRLHEEAKARLVGEAIATSQRPAGDLSRNDEKSRKIRELQSRLKNHHTMAGRFESKGDYISAGQEKARIAEIESNLRSLGA